jgi:nitric oxide reductase NorE protein
MKVAPLKIPGEAGIWMFILGDMALFALFFLTFAFYRGLDVETYRAGQVTLDQTIGLANTLILLTSSWAVAQGLYKVRAGHHERARTLFGIGVLFGLAFVGLKGIEYHEKLSAGVTLLTSDFYMLYFMYTGIHLVHVVIGIGVLVFLRAYVRKAGFGAHELSVVESGTIFWHLVDLLWVVLFALFYLMR